jgi:hypothetical protein
MVRNVLLAALVTVPMVAAQDIVSAKAGLIHLAEGDVFLNGDAYAQEATKEFKSMKEGETLATQEGRAEVLLHPGGFLRLGENSAFVLTKATYTTTRLKLTSGAVLVELDTLPKDVSVSIEVQGRQIQLTKRGLYEFNVTGAGMARVYEGELSLAAVDGLAIRVKEGQEMAFNALTPVKFDKSDTTALYRWGARRARALALVSGSSLSPSSFNAIRSINSWLWSPLCNCYYFYLVDGMYSPYQNVIYLPRVYTNVTVDNSFPRIDVPTSPASAAAVSSGAVTAGDSSGAAAMPAATAAPVTSSNTAARQR